MREEYSSCRQCQFENQIVTYGTVPAHKMHCSEDSPLGLQLPARPSFSSAALKSECNLRIGLHANFPQSATYAVSVFHISSTLRHSVRSVGHGTGQAKSTSEAGAELWTEGTSHSCHQEVLEYQHPVFRIYRSSLSCSSADASCPDVHGLVARPLVCAKLKV